MDDAETHGFEPAGDGCLAAVSMDEFISGSVAITDVSGGQRRCPVCDLLEGVHPWPFPRFPVILTVRPDPEPCDEWLDAGRGSYRYPRVSPASDEFITAWRAEFGGRQSTPTAKSPGLVKRPRSRPRSNRYYAASRST